MPMSRISQNSFLVLGRAGLDLYADPPGTRAEDATQFSAALGGSAANIAAAITRLGGSAALVTLVSDDAVGRFTLKQLQKYEIDTCLIKSIGGEVRNSLAVVETRNDNCQSVIYRNGAADFELDLSHVENISYDNFGALIFTGTSLAREPSRSATFYAVNQARAAGIAVVFDIDYRPYSWASLDSAATICARAASLSDIVVGNDVEFGVIAGHKDGLKTARELAARTADIVVYKMGERGSVCFCNGAEITTPIFRVDALKPTGAGDAFMGSFVTGLAKGLDLATCLRRGSAAAAIVVTRVGCAPAMPDASELQSFIETYSCSRPL